MTKNTKIMSNRKTNLRLKLKWEKKMYQYKNKTVSSLRAKNTNRSLREGQNGT